MKTKTLKKLVEIDDIIDRMIAKRFNQAQEKIKRPVCKHCNTKLIQFSNGWQPPVCENPICPLNDYTPKGHR